MIKIFSERSLCHRNRGFFVYRYNYKYPDNQIKTINFWVHENTLYYKRGKKVNDFIRPAAFFSGLADCDILFNDSKILERLQLKKTQASAPCEI